jgi:hypothetical protein
MMHDHDDPMEITPFTTEDAIRQWDASDSDDLDEILLVCLTAAYPGRGSDECQNN